MTKEDIQVRIEEILESHDSELKEFLSYGYNIDIRLEKDKPPKINIAKDIDTSGRNSGIRIIYDGITDSFSSREALLFSIREIGCERFYNAQKRGKVISQDRPGNAKDSSIAELQEGGKKWYVQLNGGIDQRVSFLNKIFKELGLNWSAERMD